MNLPPVDLIRALSQPLEPISTGLEPRLVAMEGIRGVVFDVYGTLVVSGSGDIGVTDAEQKEVTMRSILRDLMVETPHDGPSLAARFVELIKQDHARSRAKGIDFPEVEIREIWKDLLGIDNELLIETAAVAYECASNPIWPMPGAREVLRELQTQELHLGIVSNAQFYTPLLFESFFLRDLPDLGFDADLSFFSYRFKRAKPGTWLYEQLRDALAAREIDPAEILYVGNDALKDIHPAATLGFRTALFAGDQRSLRLREDEQDLRPPDAIITDLRQILDLLG